MPLDQPVFLASGRTVVRGACPHDCPDTCALHVTVENGRAIKVEGDPEHPTTNGVLCTKVARYLERTYSDARVLHPLQRIGNKGEGRFRRISWDEALDTIATRLSEIAASPDGPEAIVPYSYAGTMGLLQYGSMDRRFFHKLGASLLDRTICATAGKAGYVATVGASIGIDMEEFENARLIIIWGSNPIVSNLHLWSRVQEAKRRGAKLIAIDPYRSQTAEKCHLHLALLPGTDAALALGMMHVLIGENLIDRDYIDRYTLGFEQLKERVRDYPPQRVAQITGLATEQIVDLARDYGTIRPAAIRLNYGMQRHAGVELLVKAGLTPLEALGAATSQPAAAFGLSDRGRIAPGLRADLLLVEGEPDRDIRATHNIAAVWKLGVAAARGASVAPPIPAASRPDFTGTWKLNETLSGTPAGGVREVVFIIEHKDPNFKYSATGKRAFNATFSEAYECTTDGKPPADPAKVSMVGNWQAQTLILSLYKDGKELMKFSFKVSADGKQMTREADLGGGRKVHEVYDRQ